MRHLSVDIETFSSEAIGDTGLYKYAQSHDFELLLFAYAVDFGAVEVVDLAQGEKIPYIIIQALRDPKVIKHAYNAPFEWYCLNQAGFNTPLEQWHDSMFHGLYLGYTAGLGLTAEVLGLPEDKQKANTGRSLIRYFCVPCKPTKSNRGRTRNLPVHDPDRWQLFIDYCRQDVVTEIAVYKKFKAFPIPEKEQRLWVQDIEMSARGIPVDMDMISGAVAINDALDEEMVAEAKQITGVDNPNSVVQLHGWLIDQGVEVENLQKATVASLLERELSPEIKRVLEIRQELAKTSIKKYIAMEMARGEDCRIRGLLQFYGANRTGRWAGRLVQVQNLPRNSIGTLGEARKLVKARNRAGLAAIYSNISNVLSELIRTAFIPSSGKKFIVADFNAIEARVIAWLAKEAWVQNVFATHGRIYEATASQMFGVPMDKISKGNPEYELRQKGKIAQLALGYQGSVGALKAMGALKQGLLEEDLPEIVQRWRAANPNIVKLWYEIEKNAIAVMQNAQSRNFKGLLFAREGDLFSGQDYFTIRLPSGRKLYYARPFLKENQFGKFALHYYGVDQTTKKWKLDSTYGGKLTENIVQAIARDCLAESILRVSNRFSDAEILMHVHDEIILDAPPEIRVEDVCTCMGENIDWAPGLLLKAEGFSCEYYRKE